MTQVTIRESPSGPPVTFTTGDVLPVGLAGQFLALSDQPGPDPTPIWEAGNAVVLSETDDLDFVPVYLGNGVYSPAIAVTANVSAAFADGRQGTWTWDATSTLAHNFATVYAPAATPVGRWRRIVSVSNEVDLGWFNAPGLGAASTNEDTAALIAAQQFCANASLAGKGFEHVVPGGTYLVNQDNIFAQFTGSNVNGWKMRGAGYRQSTIMLDATAVPGGALYRNAPGTRKLISPIYEALQFETTDVTGEAGTVTFDPESSGHEQNFMFSQCLFFKWGTVLRCRGTLNASENTFEMCTFARTWEAVLWLDNIQAVTHKFTDCDAITLRGHLVYVGPGGGGNVSWEGGTLVMDGDTTTLPYVRPGGTGLGALNVANMMLYANPTGNNLGRGNNRFTFQINHGELGDQSGFVNGQAGTANVTIQGNFGSASGDSLKTGVTIPPNWNVDFTESQLQASFTEFEYIFREDTFTFATTANGSVNFRNNCTIPPFFHEHCYSTLGGVPLAQNASHGQFHVDGSCKLASVDPWATEFGTSSIYVTFVSEWDTLWCLSADANRREKVFDIQRQNNVPTTPGHPSLFWVLPPYSLIEEIALITVPSGATAATYQFNIEQLLDPSPTSQIIASSQPGAMNAPLACSFKFPVPWQMGATRRTRTLMCALDPTYPGVNQTCGLRGRIKYV